MNRWFEATTPPASRAVGVVFAVNAKRTVEALWPQ